MSWSFTVPSQPPSVNHSYRIVRVRRTDGGVHQQLGKLPQVTNYQLLVKNECRRARPADWQAPPYEPKEGRGLIVVRISYFLKRDLDTDNTQKAILDAIAWALDLNDRQFLGQAVYKQTGHAEPYVEIEVDA